jgi:hypothetical protein
MGALKLTHDYYVPAARPEIVLPVSESDWKRLKKLVRESNQRNNRWPVILATVSVEAAFGLTVALIGYYASSGRARWAESLLWSMLASAIVVGLTLLATAVFRRRARAISTASVLEEMEQIEHRWDIPDAASWGS